MAESLSPITFFIVKAETSKCSHILTLKWHLVLPWYVAMRSSCLNLLTMTERMKTGILPLNAKKIINLHLVSNTIQKLQCGVLSFVTRLILVRIWSKSLPKYGSAIKQSFLGTVLTIVFGVKLQKLFYTFFSKVMWVTNFIQNTFQYIYFMMKFTKSEQKLKHRNSNDLIKPVL